MARRFFPVWLLVFVTAYGQEADSNGENAHRVGEIQQPQPITELENLADLLKQVDEEEEAAEDGAEPECGPDDEIDADGDCLPVDAPEDTGLHPDVHDAASEETTTPSRDDDEGVE